MSHKVLRGADHSKQRKYKKDLLESILGVLFQLTEEADFKLVSDKQQLGTSGGGEEMKRMSRLPLITSNFSCTNIETVVAAFLPDELSC